MELLPISKTRLASSKPAIINAITNLVNQPVMPKILQDVHRYLSMVWRSLKIVRYQWYQRLRALTNSLKYLWLDMDTPTSQTLINQISTAVHIPDGRMPTPISASLTQNPTLISTPTTMTSNEVRNPLSLRLFKVLGANYDDPSTREALGILSTLYIPSKRPSIGLGGSKVNKKGKEFETKDISDEPGDESDDDKTAIIETNPPPVNANATAKTNAKTNPNVEYDMEGAVARARRNLRKDMENKLGQSSRKFLTAFAEVNKVSWFHYSTIFMCYEKETDGLRRI
jgi:hypothetical protein